MKWLAHLSLLLLLSSSIVPTSVCAQEEEREAPARPAVPDDLIDDPHIREELGVNQFTAPSIKRIFDELDQLAPLPADELVHNISKRMPLNRTDLALEIGFYIANGFMAVQAGQMAKIEPLAKELSRYGRALGAGDRVNRHAASLLENARNNNVKALKKELTATQRDVETDLIHLRDIDLAHLISLGGWIRALEVSSHAVETNFTPERAKHICREDIADYYEGSIAALDPRISNRPDLKGIRTLIIELRNIIIQAKKTGPTEADVKKISLTARKLATLALSRKK